MLDLLDGLLLVWQEGVQLYPLLSDASLTCDSFFLCALAGTASQQINHYLAHLQEDGGELSGAGELDLL
jgi:hypothetical protein